MAKKFTVIGDTQPEHDPVSTPVGLEATGAALWRHVLSQFDVSDAAGVCMLTEACRSLDRAARCKTIIDADGEVIVVKGIPREHPLLKAELASRSLCIRTLQRMGLSYEPLRAHGGRPPGLGYA
jgi:hypothetical protein